MYECFREVEKECVRISERHKEREFVRERKTAREECECVNTFQREVKKSKRERE